MGEVAREDMVEERLNLRGRVLGVEGLGRGEPICRDLVWRWERGNGVKIPGLKVVSKLVVVVSMIP